jgi:hypothetical protein
MQVTQSAKFQSKPAGTPSQWVLAGQATAVQQLGFFFPFFCKCKKRMAHVDITAQGAAYTGGSAQTTGGD